MPKSPIIPFRANEEDRERLKFLSHWLGESTAGVIRLAIERLYESAVKRDK